MDRRRLFHTSKCRTSQSKHLWPPQHSWRSISDGALIMWLGLLPDDTAAVSGRSSSANWKNKSMFSLRQPFKICKKVRRLIFKGKAPRRVSYLIALDVKKSAESKHTRTRYKVGDIAHKCLPHDATFGTIILINFETLSRQRQGVRFLKRYHKSACFSELFGPEIIPLPRVKEDAVPMLADVREEDLKISSISSSIRRIYWESSPELRAYQRWKNSLTQTLQVLPSKWITCVTRCWFPWLRFQLRQ